jgi:hypothetical protein
MAFVQIRDKFQQTGSIAGAVSGGVMIITRGLALRTLESLNVAPVFSQAYEVKNLPHDLDVFFGPPEEFFIASDTIGAYTNGRLIPILDDGNFGIVLFYDPESHVLIQKDVESPCTIQSRFANWQQYLADLRIRIAESTDDDNELAEIAELLHFESLPQTLAFLESIADGQDYFSAKEAFIKGL